MDDITIQILNFAVLAAVVVFAVAAFAKRLLAKPRLAGEPPEISKGKVPVWIYNHLDLLGLGGIIGMFYALMMIGLMAGADSSAEMEVTIEGLVISIGFQFFMAAVAFAIVCQRVGVVAWLGLAWKKWPWVFLIAPAAVLTMWAAFAGIYSIGYMELMESLGVKLQQDTVTIFQTADDPVVLVMMAFTAAVVAPVCEEIVFRGYLYPVAKKFAGPWVGGVCTALVFSAVHGGLAPLLPLFIFGMALVVLYEWTGSIWAPISAHFLFNSATVVVQLAMRYEWIQMPVQP